MNPSTGDPATAWRLDRFSGTSGLLEEKVVGAQVARHNHGRRRKRVLGGQCSRSPGCHYYVSSWLHFTPAFALLTAALRSQGRVCPGMCPHGS